jgi:hypothetical protein
MSPDQELLKCYEAAGIPAKWQNHENILHYTVETGDDWWFSQYFMPSFTQQRAAHVARWGEDFVRRHLDGLTQENRRIRWSQRCQLL